MLIFILKKTFEMLIGNIPESKRDKYRIQFHELLVDVTRAAAEGAVRGAKEQ